MSVVADAAKALGAALAVLDGVRVYVDPAAAVDPPAVAVGPPALTFETFSEDPTNATFVVFVVVPLDERALERLWELVPAARAAITSGTPAACGTASPSVFNSGGRDLPAYELTVDYPL